MGKEVIWSIQALKQTEAIHKYILEESKSLDIADKVVGALFESTQILGVQSELYALDDLKLNNNGSYRAYVKYNYRISYRILKNNIRILRIRHTSRKPLKY
ncbi:MAG: type II toxin-antitoxin system RelE/ParE family toxin [Flavobacteriaceae bacterium]